MSYDLNKVFRDNLTKAIGKCDISVVRLSRMSGINRHTINTYLAGKSVPNAKFIIALCDVLGVTPNELLLERDIDYSKYMQGYRNGRRALWNMIKNTVEETDV